MIAVVEDTRIYTNKYSARRVEHHLTHGSDQCSYNSSRSDGSAEKPHDQNRVPARDSDGRMRGCVALKVLQHVGGWREGIGFSITRIFAHSCRLAC